MTYPLLCQVYCYPPSLKRWTLFLVPGLLSALVGVCVYIFAETEDNYFYTHSLWHVLVAVIRVPTVMKFLEKF